MKYIIALDQGTTSSRAILFNMNYKIVNSAQKEYRQYFPKEGWVEQNPIELLQSQLEVLKEVSQDLPHGSIIGIGITNQRETTVLWDKITGEPVYNAIGWQCRRTSGYCKTLEKDKELIHKTSGLIIDAYFSATKIKWILDNVSGVREKAEKGDILFGTVDSWLLWNLTKGKEHKTDYTNASRTMIFDINKLEWSKELLELFNIPKNILPKVESSNSNFGITSILGYDIPITAICGDQQSSLFGQGCFSEGEAKITYGTGCFMLLNSGEKPILSEKGLLTTIGISTNNKINYALEGSVFAGGTVIKWLRDNMGVIKNAAESEYVARSIPDNGGVYIVPAFVGLGTPHWDSDARGTIMGLTFGNDTRHIVRAGLEAIAYQCYDVISVMEKEMGKEVIALKVDGGAALNDFLMEFQSAILNKKIYRPVVYESTAYGVYILSILNLGIEKDLEQIKNKIEFNRIFEPTEMSINREKLLKYWSKALERAKNWLE